MNNPLWKGDIKVFPKIIMGQTQKLSSFMDKEHGTNCLDTSVVAAYLAGRFSIFGYPEDTFGEILTRRIRVFHIYWRSENGPIIDIWEGKSNLGFLLNKNKLKEGIYVEYNPLPALSPKLKIFYQIILFF